MLNAFETLCVVFCYVSLHAGLPIDARSREKMDITAKELAEEKELAYECLKD